MENLDMRLQEKARKEMRTVEAESGAEFLEKREKIMQKK